MGNYRATIRWSRGDADFVDNRYSRGHEWRFDGGAVVAASASPQIVPEPWSVAANVDPEEAFVAALSSCHMLFFLSLAAAQGLVVDEYVDEATGKMEKTAGGSISITEVTLRPRVRCAGAPPTRATLEELHEDAHHRCFIANSVRTRITLEIDA